MANTARWVTSSKALVQLCKIITRSAGQHKTFKLVRTDDGPNRFKGHHKDEPPECLVSITSEEKNDSLEYSLLNYGKCSPPKTIYSPSLTLVTNCHVYTSCCLTTDFGRRQ